MRRKTMHEMYDISVIYFCQYMHTVEHALSEHGSNKITNYSNNQESPDLFPIVIHVLYKIYANYSFWF